MPRILSVPVALPAALQQNAALRFCAARKPFVACASLVPDAAVPWNLYGLKIAQTQLALKAILFLSEVLVVPIRENENQGRSICSDVRRHKILTVPPP
jgi:hypothetical protein